eukprot:5179521-Pyramimonas_sp.AAC.1
MRTHRRSPLRRGRGSRPARSPHCGGANVGGMGDPSPPPACRRPGTPSCPPAGTRSRRTSPCCRSSPHAPWG